MVHNNKGEEEQWQMECMIYLNHYEYEARQA
jgi:hypothetical protein